MIAISDLIQIMGIGAGAMVAMFTVFTGFFAWVVNRQEKANDRRHGETKESVDNLRQETKEEFDKARRETKEEFDKVRNEIAEVREETKEEFAKVRNEIAEVRMETKEEFAKVRLEMAQMFQRQNEENERRHQEVMKAIGLLYQHTHGEDGRMIIPIDGADLVVPPTVPAPADD